MSNPSESPDGEAVRTAVAAAEKRSSGEIVPVILPAADDYEVAYWKAATLGGLLAELVALIVLRTSGAWASPTEAALLPGLAGALGAALVVLLVPRLRPLLAGAARVDRRILQRAREAFVAYELFRTQGRTGVLICVFQLEHRVVVLADEGIHRVAPAGTWEALAAEAALAMRTDGSVPALLGAVRRCGELLAERGLGRDANDRNELGDEVRGDFR